MPSSLSLAEEEQSSAPTKKKPASSRKSAPTQEMFSPKGIALLEDIYEQNKKIKRRLAWMVFGSYLRLFIILVPLVLSIIFLPALLEQFMSQYGALFSDAQGVELFSELLNQVTAGNAGQAADLADTVSPEQLEVLRQQLLSQ